MKATRLNNLKKNIYLGIFTIMIIFLFNSCGTTVSFLNSSVVPAARGSVKVKTDNNRNYVIQISLSDLAESSRLQPSKLTYIVWMVTDRDLTKNIGQLNSSKGFMSKQLKGSFKTVSSDKPVKIFITAEDDAAVQYPGAQIVLSTDKFQL
ncbi:MAG: hypothetical protein ABR927_11490 [Bacteroidales bacterium]|jgi:hypothetical protein